MASITIDNLQPMMGYEELSDSELESVIGGNAAVFAGNAARLAVQIARRLPGLPDAPNVASAMAMAH